MKYLPLILSIFFILTFSLIFVNAATPDGSTAAGDNMNIFITSLFIVTMLGLFYSLFITIAKVVTADETLYDLLLAWSSYILLIIVNHLTAHYVEDVFMYNLTESFLSATAWTNIVLPLIAFVLSLIIKGFQKKRPPSVQELAGRGMY